MGQITDTVCPRWLAARVIPEVVQVANCAFTWILVEDSLAISRGGEFLHTFVSQLVGNLEGVTGLAEAADFDSAINSTKATV